MPGDTEGSLWALVGGGQGELLLFFKASWDPYATRSQGGAWISQLVPVSLCPVAMTRTSPQGTGSCGVGPQTLTQWGWGFYKFENIVAALGVSEASQRH